MWGTDYISFFTFYIILHQVILFCDIRYIVSFLPLKTCFKFLKKCVESLTCHSNSVTFHTDSVFSSLVIPQQSAVVGENPDRRPVVVIEAFQSSSAALPLPSKHIKNFTMRLKLLLCTEMKQTDQPGKHTSF